jgi:exodeoxyribonuclease VIII
MEAKATIEYVKDSFEEYLSKKDHISASDIKTFLQSPAKYYYEKYVRKEKEEKKHLTLGTAIHELILEPHLFKTNYMVFPKVDGRTKEGKAAMEKFKEMSEGKIILNEEEMDMINGIAKNAMNNHTLVELLKDSHREVSCYTIDEKTELKVRMRPDILPQTKRVLGDLKSCMDSSKKKFKTDCYSHGYSLSAAFYGDFLGRENYIFVACAKTAPYEVALYVMDDEMVQFGREQYRMGLDLIKFCQDNDYYPSHNAFELLKMNYDLGSLETYFDDLKNSELITIL